MRTRIPIASLLIALAIVSAAAESLHADAAAPRYPLVWYGFLLALPVLLSAGVLAGYRWVLMGAVMYGTIDLALDLSTLMQPAAQAAASIWLSAALNAALIAAAGRAFLHVAPEPLPPASRRPNPPSPPEA
jgi:hypothetical protein